MDMQQSLGDKMGTTTMGQTFGIPTINPTTVTSYECGLDSLAVMGNI